MTVVDEAAILRDLQRLVNIESPSADHDAVARSAEAVKGLVAKRTARAAEVLTIDGVSHVRLRGGQPRVLLLAHHDTVWPTGTLDRIPFAVQDGVIRGPGCFDMKLGLVQAIHAMAAQPHLLDQITLLVTGDEEVGSITSRALIEDEARRCRAVLVLEAAGDGGALKIARKGVSMYTLRVSGRAAHAGLEPERGVNAGIALAELVLRLSSLGDASAGTTVTPTRMSAGTTNNTVPAEARVEVDVRARTGVEQLRVDAAIRAIESSVPGARVVVDGGPNRPPLERDRAAALFKRASELTKEEIAGIEVGGGSDGNFTGGLGIATLDGLGAVGGGAHADDEHALVEFIVPRTNLLVELIAANCD